MRQLVALPNNDQELDDLLRLSNLLTQNPSMWPAVSDEVAQISARLIELAGDHPAVWCEVAWADLRHGNLDAARSGFQRYLAWIATATQQQQAELSPKGRSSLDGMRQTAAERSRMTHAGLALVGD